MTALCYFKRVPDRERAKLDNIISSIVVKSTIICTEHAKIYDWLDEIVYIHFDVYHRKKFSPNQDRIHQL